MAPLSIAPVLEHQIGRYEVAGNDQSTGTPHVRYPHEKQNLSKGLLTIVTTIVVPLRRPY